MGTVIYQDALITCTRVERAAGLDAPADTIALVYESKTAAGAIGQTQGESWAQALSRLQQLKFQTLHLKVNSAGAHFGEPMEGLFYLNAIAERLWQLRRQGIHIQVECPGWLYGGMAMILTSVAHEIILHPQAHMGLFGPKVLGKMLSGAIPALGFQAEHVQVTRLS